MYIVFVGKCVICIYCIYKNQGQKWREDVRFEMQIRLVKNLGMGTEKREFKIGFCKWYIFVLTG